jgi:hypothetical protein
MAGWARKVARDPNATTPAEIQALSPTRNSPSLCPVRCVRPSPTASL